MKKVRVVVEFDVESEMVKGFSDEQEIADAFYNGLKLPGYMIPKGVVVNGMYPPKVAVKGA